MVACLALIILGLVLGLIIAEVLSRAYFHFAPEPEDAFFMADPKAGFLRHPSSPARPPQAPDDFINSLGFRDREPARSKSAERLRILGIGDSFVYSLVPLDENFLRVAEGRIAGSLPKGYSEVEMLMMGMGGWSPENEVGVLESLGLGLDPDFVVLNFFVGNDVTDIPLRGKVLRGKLFYTGSPYPLLNAMRKSLVYLLTERYLLYRLRDRLLERRVDAEAPRAASPPVAEAETFSTHYLHHQVKRLPVYALHPPSRIEHLWQEAEGCLDRFDRLCREAKIPWLLHIIPAGIQVDEDLRARVLEALDHPAADYDFDLPQRRLAAFAAERGIRIVDALPLMRRSHKPDSPLYLNADTHWNTRGNRLAGEALSDSILMWMSD